MELYQLRTFIAVADEGNLTRASERLFTSQPAISAHIKALEEELNVKLFDRTPKGMILTPEGELLKRKALQVLNAARDFSTTANAMQGQLMGDVRIGVNTDGEFLRLSSILSQIREHHPNLKLRFISDISGNIVDGIQHEILDCGFFYSRTIGNQAEIKTDTLVDANFVFCASIAWKDKIVGASWEQITELPWVFPIPQCPYTQIFEAVFAQYQKRPDDVAYASSEASLNALIKEGAGVSLMREDEAREWADRKMIVIWDKEIYSMPLHFAFLKSRENDPTIMALREVVRASWQKKNTQPLRVIS